MGRAGRSFEEGRIYHTYNDLGGGSMELGDEELAAIFVSLMREGMRRDGVSRWRRRGAVRRAEDSEFAAAVGALDQAASEDP